MQFDLLIFCYAKKTRSRKAFLTLNTRAFSSSRTTTWGARLAPDDLGSLLSAVTNGTLADVL